MIAQIHGENNCILPTPQITPLPPWACERIILSLLQVGLMLADLFKKISYLAHNKSLVRYLGNLRGFPTAKLVPWGDLGKLLGILVE